MGMQGKQVLIVEDDPLIALVTEDMLSEMGALAPVVATTVDDAIAEIDRHRFDVAILDFNLKGDHSLLVAQCLREQGVPFVFATGYPEAVAKKSGDALVLGKPFTEADLADALAKLLPN
jgi:CheY-like chemotaxis protein